jgi:hypothetical protein
MGGTKIKKIKKKKKKRFHVPWRVLVIGFMGGTKKKK